MILVATGHRPSKLKLGGYGREKLMELRDFAVSMLEAQDPDLVVTGMALGWDQAVADASHCLNIPYLAAVPFVGQDALWSREQQEYYNDLLFYAFKVHIVNSGGYVPWKLDARNKWMVDQMATPFDTPPSQRPDKLLALWSGVTGGTANCVKYAESKLAKSQIVNIWSKWKEWKEG